MPENLNKIGKVEKRDITDELRESYLDYAMSVIVSRALPDVRDGLKPVQRRILWTMWDMGLTHAAKFIKSARVVGECFVKDSFITTTKGLIPIQNIKIGDDIYTQTGIKKVKMLYEMPPKRLLKVILENGQSNIVTPSQKFKILTPELSFKWKGAKDLTQNDYLVLRATYPEIEKPVKLGVFENNQTIYLNENVAYLLGFFISDGWITRDYSKKKLPRIGFVAENKKILEKIKNILEKEFNYSPTIEIKKYKIQIKNGQILDKELYKLRINRKAINEFLASAFGLKNKWALTKEIPQQIFQSPQSIIFSFISGLIEGDGCVSKPKKENLIHYGSISEKLIDQLIVLLLSQGIFSSKYITDNRKKAKSCILGREVIHRYKFYSLEIRGENAIKLASKIVLVDKIKDYKLSKLRFKEFTNYDRKGLNKYDIIPCAGKVLFQELSEAHLGSGWYQDFNGNKFRMGIKYPGGSKIRYSSDLQNKPLRKTQIVEWGIKEKLERINSPFFDFIDLAVKNNLYFVKVSSIKRHSPEITYDLEVEDDHEFIANSIVSHNCMGKYHPHGDMAIYDALVRMAQDFSLRYPLAIPQGNVGSVDGDSASAMRYLECKLSKISEELLFDIEKETTDWQPNYDSTRQEPKVLPAKLPNLLLNGSMGIAVGMATNIPPHNLNEVIEALIYLISHPKAGTEDLMQFVQGPDFPTGGIIYNKKAITEAYVSGRGPVTCRATVEIEESKAGQPSRPARPAGGFNIVVTEIPYQVNKAELVTKIAELVQEKRIEGIRDLRDESDREGTRIVIELKNDVAPQKILNQLYKYTDLQKDFHFNMIALIDGLQPQLLSLKEILGAYLDHRKIVVERRTKFELNKTKERSHILEGLTKALSVIDEVISTIKKSRDRNEAFQNLIKKFKFTDIQANAILEMKLQTLAGLERQKIEDELKEKRKLIIELELLLRNPGKILNVIKEEFLELKKNYGDERRTKVMAGGLKEFKEEDLVPQEEVIITLSRGGYIKRATPNTIRIQRRGGKGLIGSEVSEEDFITHFISANTHDNILFFTDRGRAFQTKVYEIPVGSRTTKGKLIQNFLEIPSEEKVSAIVAYKVNSQQSTVDSQYLVMATKNGLIKKTALEDFSNVRRSGLIAINLQKADQLKWVRLSSGKDEIILVTDLGQAIRFKESQLRPMGRTATGVRAIRLKKSDQSRTPTMVGDDFVTGLDIIKESQKSKVKSQKLLIVTENGFAKQTPIGQYKVQSRGGQGIKTAKITSKTGPVVAAQILSEQEELLALSTKGQIIKTKISGIRTAGRATSGVRIMKLNSGDKVAGIVCL